MASTLIIALAGIAYAIVTMIFGFLIWEVLFKSTVQRLPHLRAEVPIKTAHIVNAVVSLYVGIVFAYVYDMTIDLIPADGIWKGAVMGFVLFMFFPLPMKIVSKMYHKEPMELLWPYMINWLLTLVVGGLVIATMI